MQTIREAFAQMNSEVQLADYAYYHQGELYNRVSEWAEGKDIRHVALSTVPMVVYVCYCEDDELKFVRFGHRNMTYLSGTPQNYPED